MSYDKLRSIIKESLSTLTAESKADGYKDPAYRATIKQFKGKKVSKEEFAQALAMHHKSMDEDINEHTVNFSKEEMATLHKDGELIKADEEGKDHTYTFSEGKITEAKTFKPGDMWSDDFDYRGMLKFGAKYKKTGDYKKDIKVMKALHNSFEDVNYHSESSPLWDAMKLYTSAFAAKKRSMETYRKLADQCDIKLKEFNKNCAKTLRTIKDGINEISTKNGLADVIKGRTSAIEGIKISKDLAQAISRWINTSPYGRKYGKHILKGRIHSLIGPANAWGIERGFDSKTKQEWKALYAKHGPKKEAVIEQLKELQTIDEHHNDEDFPGKDLTAWELLDKIKPANLDLYNKVEDFMKSMNEVKNCGCGKTPCETYGNVNEDYSQRARNFRVALRRRLEAMKSGKKIKYGKLAWTALGNGNFKDSKGKTVPSEEIVKDLKLAVKPDILQHRGADGSTMVNAYLKLEGKLDEMDINDPILIAVRARKTMIAKAKAAPKVKKISTKQYYKLMDAEIDLIDQMKDAAKEYERLDSEMNQDAGQKGDAWTDADANRYGGDLDKLQTKIEKLAKQKLAVKKQIMNYRIN